jgi:HEAT repeat protein
MISDEMRDDHIRAWLHGSLARLGEKGSTDQLRQWLGHKEPEVRLAAADCLWRLGSRDGLKTLVDLLDLRPIETGREGVKIGGEAIIKVTGLERTNLDVVRAACTVLGEMKDRSAIEALERLGQENLNGILATGGSGTGWPGRPDVVALARMGDFSGIDILRKSIAAGDRLGAAGSWCRGGDYVEIGLKRFIPDVIPLLDHHEAGRRVYAAQTILRLLESGQ